MPDQNRNSHYLLPEPIKGYELSPQAGLWSIVVPELTQNIMTSPVWDSGALSNYSISGGGTGNLALQSILSTGFCSLSGINIGVLTTTGGTQVLSNAITVKQNTIYCFSLELATPTKGQSVTFRVSATLGGTILGQQVTTSQGKDDRGMPNFQRPFLIFNSGALTTVYLEIVGTLSGSPVIYTDAWQCEAKSYPTTYCDGFQPDCSWNGPQNASTSVRLNTGKGGRVLNFLDSLQFRMTGFKGAGMVPQDNISVPKGFRGGEYFQRKANRRRILALDGALIANNLTQLHILRQAIEDAIVSDNVSQQTDTLYLRYQPRDICGDPRGRPVEIPVQYFSGLEGQIDNLYQERISLQFLEFQPPSVKELYGLGSNLSLPAGGTLASKTGTFVFYKNPQVPDSTYFAELLLSGTTHVQVTAVVSATAGIETPGTLYAPYFQNTGPENGVGKITGLGTATPTLTTIAGSTNTAASSNLLCAVVDAAGNLFVGGSQATPFAWLMEWNGFGWGGTWLGAQPPAATIRCLALDIGGNIYAGGDGTTANNRLIKITNGTCVDAVGGAGINGVVRACVRGPDGKMYFAGDFTSVKGITCNRIAVVDQFGQVSALGTGMDNPVYSLAFDLRGFLYAVGQFANAGGITCNGSAYWNGTQWSPLPNFGIGAGTQMRVNVDSKGVIYLSGGSGTYDGKYIFPGRATRYMNGTWKPLPYHTDLLDEVQSLSIANDTIFLGFASTGGTVVVKGIVPTRINPYGTAGSYPKVVISGTGTLFGISNFTTNQHIYFSRYVIQGSEVITATFTPDGVTIVSSTLGNIMGYVLPGSDTGTFGLAPKQDNMIGVLTQSISNQAQLTWTPAHWSVDGGAY